MRAKGHPSGTVPYWRYEKGLLRPDQQSGFRTTSKVELYYTNFVKYGLDPLLYYKEPLESPISTPDIWKDYPLILITGRRNEVMLHSEHGQTPWLREINPDPTVEIHPDTAKAHGMEDGNWVWIEACAAALSAGPS